MMLKHLQSNLFLRTQLCSFGSLTYGVISFLQQLVAVFVQ